MRQWINEVAPWLAIVAALTVCMEAGGPRRWVRGLCAAVGVAIFLHIVQEWALWICAGLGALLGMGGFFAWNRIVACPGQRNEEEQ